MLSPRRTGRITEQAIRPAAEHWVCVQVAVDGYKAEACNTGGQIKPAVTISGGELMSCRAGMAVTNGKFVFTLGFCMGREDQKGREFVVTLQ